MLTRRDMTRLMALFALSQRAVGEEYRSPHYPFTLGVASGDPSESTIVLWTRLAPHVTGGPMLGDAPVAVRWELARDERFSSRVANGTFNAVPQTAHSVHIEVEGLKPGQAYYYRFYAGGHTSTTGHTRTLRDLSGEDADGQLDFVTASCQDLTQGYFNAYRHVAETPLDFVIHLGDYIYDWPHAPGAKWGSRDFIRRHQVDRPVTLADFRTLHGQYKRERSLQQAHAAHPWFVLPDNHDGVQDTSTPAQRRFAALQAYYEHMPIRLGSGAGPIDRGLKRHFFADIDALARFVFLDTRQFRDPQAICGAGTNPPIRGAVNSSIQPVCPELLSAERTMLGSEQREFLSDALSTSNARWNFIVSSCVMTPFDFDPPNKAHYLYGWDGYPVERAAILSEIDQLGVSNPVVLSGDWHSFWVNDVSVPGVVYAASPPLEFATTGVTSRYPGNPRLMQDNKAANPQVRYLNTEDRGYMRFSLTRDRLRVACVGVDCKTDGRAPAEEVARFSIDRAEVGNARP